MAKTHGSMTRLARDMQPFMANSAGDVGAIDASVNLGAILLNHAGSVTIYPPTVAGLLAAAAAAVSGDSIEIKSGSYTTDFTVPAGVSVQCAWGSVFLYGQLTLNQNSLVNGLVVNNTGSSSGALAAVVGCDTGECHFYHGSALATNSGAGDAYGVQVGQGTIYLDSSHASGTATGGGTGYAVKMIDTLEVGGTLTNNLASTNSSGNTTVNFGATPGSFHASSTSAGEATLWFFWHLTINSSDWIDIGRGIFRTRVHLNNNTGANHFGATEPAEYFSPSLTPSYCSIQMAGGSVTFLAGVEDDYIVGGSGPSNSALIVGDHCEGYYCLDMGINRLSAGAAGEITGHILGIDYQLVGGDWITVWEPGGTTTGVVYLYNCIDTGILDAGTNGGAIYVDDAEHDPSTDTGNVIALASDRAVWDAKSHAARHTNDADYAANSLHHTLGTGPNQAAAGSHTHAGTGDMLKSTYDTDNDGVVDNAEALQGHPASDFALASALHNPVTVADTTTIDLTLTGQQISGVVLPGGFTLNQVGAPSADVSINSHKLTSVTDPTNPQDAATKAYVDAHTPTITLYEPLTDGDPDNPQLIFVSGDIVMVPMTF